MLKKLIEFVWPSLEGDAPTYNNFLDEETEIGDENLDASVDFAKFMYDKQGDRISTIESKSSIYIGFFGTIVAILTFSLKDILFLEEKNITHDVTLLFGGLLIVYISQVMRYSIKALERKNYYSFDEGDFLHGDKRKTVVDLINKIKKNYDVINCKVDFMTMAHEFTKRIIGVLFVAAISLIVLSLYKYVSLIPPLTLETSFFTLDIRWSDWLLLVVIVIVIFNYIQLRRIEKKIEK